jgi:hypothetical protein
LKLAVQPQVRKRLVPNNPAPAAHLQVLVPRVVQVRRAALRQVRLVLGLLVLVRQVQVQQELLLQVQSPVSDLQRRSRLVL